jgi:hypothetical protein
VARIIIEPGTVLVPAVEADPAATPPVEAKAAVVAPSLLEVFDLAEAAKVADPTLTIQMALRKVVYELAAQHHELAPCDILP